MILGLGWRKLEFNLINKKTMKKTNNKSKRSHLINNEKGNSLAILFIAGFAFLIIFIVFVSFLLINNKDKRNYEKEEEKYVFVKETPLQVIKFSREAMKNIKTVKLNGKMGISALMVAKNQSFPNFPIDYSYDLDLGFTGYIDESDLDNTKAQFNLDVGMDILSEGGSEEISFNLDCINIEEDDLYYRLNSYDLGMMGMMIGSELKRYKGKWLAAKLPDERSYNSRNNSDLPDIEEINEIYAKYEVLKFEEDLGDKKLGDTEVYHYKMKLDSANFADLMEELESQNEESENKDNTKLLGRIFENIDLELWIGKRDKFLRQVKISGDYDTEDFKQIFSETYGEAKMRAEDTSIKSGMSSIERSLEYYYKSAESYDDFSVSSYYAKKIKQENIITSKDSYAIWQEMASTTDKWCIDSTGKSGYVQEEIKSPVCPKTSAEPQGEKRDYKEYAYNLFSKEMGEGGKIEVEFNLDFSFSRFNKLLRIEKPKDVEEVTKSGLFSFGKDVPSILEEESEISYNNDDLKNGYVMGESVSVYSGFEKLFKLFNFLQL